jgi:hypothetical protein
MQSTVHLFNVALAKLGGEQLNMNRSPLEQGTTGEICENLFPQVLDLTLAVHEWSFAKKRLALALVSGQQGSGEYPLVYELPTDCLKPGYLEGYAGINRKPAYVIEGQTLLSAQEGAVLVYVARVTDPRLWPPSFAEALGWGLAGELASAVLNNSQKQAWCYQNYKIALADAIARDCSGQNPTPPRSAWQAARFGS